VRGYQKPVAIEVPKALYYCCIEKQHIKSESVTDEIKVKKMKGRITTIGFIASMLSVVGSLYIYFGEANQHLGIFVGLWAPTLILASKEIEQMLEPKS